MTDPNAVYALGHNPAESARLQRQADELAPESTTVLDRTALGTGQHAIDLGCGPRGVLDLMAERVGPGGRVVGVDADPAHTAMAAAFAAERGLGNVEVLTADARTGMPPESFDVVHCRTLLVTVPDPTPVVAEMARPARPGGWVGCVEADAEYALCHPANDAFDRLSKLFLLAFGRNGANPCRGRRVPELLRQAGLVDVDVAVTPQMYPAGHTRRTIRLDLAHSLRPHIAEMGLASADASPGLSPSPGSTPRHERPRSASPKQSLYAPAGRRRLSRPRGAPCQQHPVGGISIWPRRATFRQRSLTTLLRSLLSALADTPPVCFPKASRATGKLNDLRCPTHRHAE